MPRRTQLAFSVRTRITVVITLLAALAMAGAGLIVYVLESARVEAQTNEQIDQEIAEFTVFQETGRDPRNNRPFQSAQRILEFFLSRNVPDDDEMIVIYPPSGEGAVRSPNLSYAPLIDMPEYEQALDDLQPDGGTLTFDDIEPFGEVWVTLVPVVQEGNTQRGSLVVVNFLDDERSEINDTIRTYTIVALLSLGLIVLLASTQSGRLLAPLRVLRDTADEITETDLSRRLPERGNDDITALTRTFNTMLDRLEGGFGAQRRFLDDAGHELKTPLTVLRGHLELLDTGDPDDVAETKELLLQETDRMARLVGDLILLAKADRPDFVRPAPVDVAGLTEDVLAKARVLGEREWRDDGVAGGLVLADEQRLTQALLQLADNAVKHTGPGDLVAIGSSADAETVRVWVRDTGDGVPEADRDQIFTRFGRSIVRDGDEGFGLGLSIVSAIVDAHEGTVHVEDASPQGARFVITLRRPPADTRPVEPIPPQPSRPDTRPDEAHAPATSGGREEQPAWPAS